MRRITLFLMMSILLIITQSVYLNNASNDGIVQEDQKRIVRLSPNQVVIDPLNGKVSKPILISVQNSTDSNNLELITPIRERNETLGEGAIHQVQLYQNVTFIYVVANGNENTTMRLYAEVPNLNLTNSINGNENESLVMSYLRTEYEINYTLPYNKDLGVFSNVSLAYFKVKLNVSADFIPYYAAVQANDAETTGSAPTNLLTVNQYWSTKSVDEFYIQNENVTISLDANQTAVTDEYGIKYRSNTNNNYVEMNFTKPTTSQYNASLNLGDFAIGTTVYWESFAYLFDVSSNLTRRVEGIEVKTVEVQDGTPSIFTEIVSNYPDAILLDNVLYTQSPLINISIQATVPKGNISTFNVTLDTASGIVDTKTIQVLGNFSTEGETFNLSRDFGGDGEFELFLSATTNKNLEINTTYTVYVDSEKPVVVIESESLNQEITADFGMVTFSFNFNDNLAGVRIAILDLGDGFSVEVTNMNNYTYIYTELDRNYVVTLTVIDWAGNTQTFTTGVTLVTEDFNQKSVVNTELWLLGLIIVALVSVYMFQEQLTSFFEKFRR